MPIEIKELVIRAVVGAPEDGASGDADRPAAAAAASGPGGAALDLDEVVQECVRQVLRILARERER